MSKAIRIHRAGGPEEMLWEDVEVPAPAEGEVQVRHTAIGLNYIDVYDRTGLYPMPLPGVLGREAAGVVTAIGRKAKGFRKGDRVAYVHTVPGSYSELRNVPAARLVKLPRSVSDEQAAAIMLKGLTAEYLLRRTCRVQRGDWIEVQGLGLCCVRRVHQSRRGLTADVECASDLSERSIDLDRRRWRKVER